MTIALHAEASARALRRIASEIVEQTAGAAGLALVGIRRGGVPLADLIAAEIEQIEDRRVPVGAVDITLYRDDAATALPDPKIGPSDVTFDIAGRHVVLVDDVLQTGRTVRAAIDCLLDYGRPKRVWLAVLCDRGGRELPVAADFVGRALDVGRDANVEVVTRDGATEVIVEGGG